MYIGGKGSCRVAQPPLLGGLWHPHDGCCLGKSLYIQTLLSANDPIQNDIVGANKPQRHHRWLVDTELVPRVEFEIYQIKPSNLGRHIRLR